MSISKIFSSLLLVPLLVLSMVVTVHASISYEYIDGYGMVEVENMDSYPTPSVDNSGTFGLSVEGFRHMCMQTGGDWDVVSGRHVCYCPQGKEFNYPFGCPAVEAIPALPAPTPPVSPTPVPATPTPVPATPTPDYNENGQNGEYKYNGFRDIEGHRYQWYIEKLASLGIIKGYEDGTFRPDSPVSRAEMAKMVLMAAKLETLPCDNDSARFFADLDSWQAPWVNAGYRMDIIEGYGASESGVRLFKPNNYVNRVEGVKLVLAAFGRTPSGYEKWSHRYSDVYDWMTLWIEDAYRIGLIDTSPDGQFYPGDPMTRGMAAKVIVKMLQYAGDI